jgi:hypothetical protein
MKRFLPLLLLSIFCLTQPSFSQVFADFEDGTTQNFGKYWGDALTTFRWAADPTAKSAGVLELVCDAAQGDHKAAIGTDPLDLKWTGSKKGAYFLTFDVYLPADFPTTPTVKVWCQVAEGSWQWMDYKYLSGGLAIKAGQWNTIHFPIAFANQQTTNFDPKLHIKGGIEIYFPADVTWTGSILVDNASLWGVESKLVADFAKDTQGFGKYWGDALTTFQWAADPMDASNGVLELKCDAAQGDHKAAIGTDPIDLMWKGGKPGVGFYSFDVYLPADFPTTPTVKVWSQVAEGSWQWMDYKYLAGGLAIKAGQWNTIHFPVVFANQQTPAYDPTLHIKGGIEIYFPSDVTWAGSILVDNYRFHTLEVGKKWVYADFEKQSLGTYGFNNTGWNNAMTNIAWAADPSGQSVGVLQTDWNSTLDTKAQFVNENLDLKWTATDTGATAMTIDVWVPPGTPTGTQISIWATDKKSWSWTEKAYTVSDTTVKPGKWNTLVYNVLDYPALDPVGVIRAGIQVYFTDRTWTGTIYFDNFTFIGIEKPVGALKSPAVSASVDTTTLHHYVYNHITWTDNEDNLSETYNVYMSTSPIKNLTDPGVIRIGTKIPRGVQFWNHRPYTTFGVEQSFYYAVTATSADNEETAMTDNNHVGPITVTSSPTLKAVWDPNFNFVIDGTLSEFAAYQDYTVLPEGPGVDQAGDWTPASTDLNFTANFVTDGKFLYVGANIIDDDLATSGQGWEGDGFELFMGFYDIKDQTAWHDLGDIDAAGTGDYRISFTSWGTTQKGGSSDFRYPGMTFLILPNPTGYLVEAKIQLDSIGATGWVPQAGDMLPLRIDCNDKDEVLDGAGTGRTKQLNTAGVGNTEGWKRPSSWGYLEFFTPTGVAETGSTLPKTIQLHDNYPNPFNPTTTLRYDLAKNAHVSMVIYNMLGQKIRTLVDGVKPAGYHAAVWNGTNDAGVHVASGIYFIEFKADGYAKTNKMILMK